MGSIEMRIEKSFKTEPIAIPVSMALTALAVSYVDNTNSIWRRALSSLIFILGAMSTTQLYWSLIIPLLKDGLNLSSNDKIKNRYMFLVLLFGFYGRNSIRFIIGRCNAKEMMLLGYLNGLAAFIVLFFAQLLHIIELVFRVRF